MKRLSLALLGAILLTAFGPVPSVSANWWWHRNSNPPPAGVGSDNKTKKSKNHRQNHSKRAQNAPLYATPKSVGWWHKSPGPMGAGSGNDSKSTTKTAHNKKQNTTTQASHKSPFNWFHHTNNATAANPQATGAGK
jgi:hypothetical protein